MRGLQPATDRAISSLQANLASAEDEQVARVVALVDALPQRGAADDLIAPLRLRLQQLRPKRRVAFARLLFTPLDPLLVPPQHWQRGSMLVPRNVVAPVAAALYAVMLDAKRLEAQAAALDAADREAIAQVGRVAWPAAATACEKGLPFVEGNVLGLADRDWTDLVSLITAILHVAVEIEAVVADLPGDGQDAAVRTLLRHVAPHGPTAFGAVVTILLARLAVPERVVGCAAEIAGSTDCRTAIDVAVGTALDGVAAALREINASGKLPTGEIQRLAMLLNGLEPCYATRSERQLRIEAMRREAGEACRRIFQHTVTEGILRRVKDMPNIPNDGEIAGLEASARDLRRIEVDGRRLGNEGCDILLKSCRKVFRSDELTLLALADRVRMLEILGAPDEALALLNRGQTYTGRPM